MRRPHAHSLKLALLFGLAGAGCAFAPGEPGEELAASDTAGGSGTTSGGAGSGATGLGPGSGSGLASGGDVGVTGSGGSGADCGQMNVPIMPIPADVLIVQDKSSSMSNDDSDQSCSSGCGANSKWSQVTAALTEVVNATQNSINWGLKFFSDNSACDASAAPVVDVGPMNGMAVATAIAATKPGGNTPTRDAISNGAGYLSGLTDKNNKFLLLATDGLPNCPVGCAAVAKPSGMCTMTDNPNEDMAAEAAVAAALQQGFKTFVIGIGNVSTAVNTLNQMATNGGEAQSGGATSYYAAMDSAALEAALNDIVGHVSSCTISLSGAPSGLTNVAISADASGKAIEIPPDTANGWSYGTDMSTVILNGSACTDLQNGTYSNFQFYYACAGKPIRIGAAVAR